MMRRIYFTDMNAMQMELTQITRDRHNPAFHSKYATEAAIDAAARPIYTKYGFSITYGTAPPLCQGISRSPAPLPIARLRRNATHLKHPLSRPTAA